MTANTQTEDEPQLLAFPAQQRLAQISSSGSNLARPINSELSRTGPQNEPGCNPIEFAKSMARLTEMKRTAALTELQLDAWFGVLGLFPIQILNAAVIEICLSQERFPELSDLYHACATRAKKRGWFQMPFCQNGTPEITIAEIEAVAERLGLDV